MSDIIVDFIAGHRQKIWSIAKMVYKEVDENIQLMLKTAYSDYLGNTREKYSKSKSFFIRDKSVDLYSYYQPTGIKSGKMTIEAPTFVGCIRQSSRLIITGTGGSGKSILMKHLFLDCIKEQSHAPILIELRDMNHVNMSLDKFINETLETYGFNTGGDYVQKAKKSGGFAFFLDGYDEVYYKKRKKLLREIKTLSNRFAECPIVISSRPDDDFHGIDDFMMFSITPLTLKTASGLIEKLPFDTEIKAKFTGDLKRGLFEKHKSFLSNPLLLSIMLLTYGEHAEIPSKLSIFYNQAYEALFQRHDANKGGYRRQRHTTLDMQDFAKVFALFALQTYEKRLFKMSRTESLGYIEKAQKSLGLKFKAGDYLDDLLISACLMVEDGLEVAFSHRSFQEYFVARYIDAASPELQEKLIARYWENIGSDNVIKLLLEIDADLVERVLFIPKLEAFFEQIGVKKRVGISHATKYLQALYTSIQIDGGIALVYKDAQMEALARIFFLVCEYDEMFWKGDELYGDFMHQMHEQYGKENKGTYLLSTLSYKSPLMQDLLTQKKGWLTISYLERLFDVYKKLKKKHHNPSKKLDDLLGL